MEASIRIGISNTNGQQHSTVIRVALAYMNVRPFTARLSSLFSYISGFRGVENAHLLQLCC